MKGTHCGSEWTVEEGMFVPSECPSCGEPLSIKIAGEIIPIDVTELELNDCEQLTDLSPLASLSQLQKLDVSRSFNEIANVK